MVERNSRSGGRRASAGFTLVELMVVISIIAMLMALLLPAVQSARETGRRNTCQNNQHQLSLALMNYNDTKKAYPGWNNWLSASAAGSSTITGSSSNLAYAEVTFVVPLFPYMEQNVVYNNYVTYVNALMNGTSNTSQLAALGQSQVYIQSLVCPSNPPTTQTGVTPLAYCINGGQIDASAKAAAPVIQSGTVNGTAVSSTSQLQAVAAASGIAYDQTGYSSYGAGAGTSGTSPTAGTSGLIVKVSQDYVSSKDGTTYTLLLSENTLGVSSWSLLTNGALASGSTAGGGPGLYTGYSGASTGPSPLSEGSIVVGPQMYSTTFMWANAGSVSSTGAPPTGYYPIDGDKTDTSPGPPTGYTMLSYARPASFHNGVCVFAFCGGNVRPITDDIDYRVFKQLMTPFGGTTNTTTGISGSGDLDSANFPVSDNF